MGASTREFCEIYQSIAEWNAAPRAQTADVSTSDSETPALLGLVAGAGSRVSSLKQREGHFQPAKHQPGWWTIPSSSVGGPRPPLMGSSTECRAHADVYPSSPAPQLPSSPTWRQLAGGCVSQISLVSWGVI